MTLAEVAARIAIHGHDKVCPRHGLFCECMKCSPPPCLCALVFAVREADADAVRLAFWDAVAVTQ